MKKKLFKGILLIALAPAVLSSCKKDDSGDTDVAQLKKDILSDAATTVITASYEEMYARAQALSAAVTTLTATPNDNNITAARQAWKDMRVVWEQTESWLFGPVDADAIDPRIDTWPVDFNALNEQLSGGNEFTDEYIAGLDEDLKGFHPIEFLLWGENGNKTAASLTDREKEYLTALTRNLVALTQDVRDSWASNGYAVLFKTAGEAGNSTFATVQSAYMELIDAMAGICDEVANAKMLDPFDAGDPSQEESPFAKNSITDFTNNIQGILNIYQGKFIDDGKGIEDLVRNYNLSLDQEIKTKHATAIAALNAITVPFGDAISQQALQVQAAMDKINDLAATLDTKLKPFLQQYAQ